jgi:hypothetical protein
MSLTTNNTKTNMVPTFLLKGINPNEFFDKYKSGYFQNLTFPESKVEIPKNTPEIFDNIGSNYYSQMYEYTNHMNSRQRIYTTNHCNFITFATNNKNTTENNTKLKYYELNSNPQPCVWCRKPIKKRELGIPHQISYRPKTNTYVIHTGRDVCSFNCMITFVRRKANNPFIYQSPYYIHSESIVHTWFNLCHPDKILREAPEWDLHEINGGPLSDKDFFNDKYIYQPLPNIITLPCKEEYFRSEYPKRLKLVINNKN